MVHEHRPLRGHGNAVIVLLSFQLTLLAARLGVRYLPLPWHLLWLIGRLDRYANYLTLVTGIVFVMWFYRARVNAEASGWRQRRARAWAFWGWLAPVANLWVPFQLMADIWRASLPEDQRGKTAWLPGLWWLCLLAGCGAGGWRPGLAWLAAAAGLLIVIVGRVTDSPIG